jgi:hypothetical protein
MKKNRQKIKKSKRKLLRKTSTKNIEENKSKRVIKNLSNFNNILSIISSIFVNLKNIKSYLKDFTFF